jgi:hypothetical protein
MDYSNGKIYKLICNVTGLVYIGSTCSTLVKRKCQHLKDFKRWKNNKYHYVTSFRVLENDNFDIVLIEEFPCENKNELHRQERFHIDSIECVNKLRPTRSKKEYGIQYRIDNAERKKEYMKNYRMQNSDKIKTYNKTYYDKKKESNEKPYLPRWGRFPC